VVPVLNWQPCNGSFKCATAVVPLDYGNPGGSTIDLAVIKHVATDPAHRIGSLLFNPGGPGGAGTQYLPAWYDFFPAQVRARFDIVSFDPRGIGASTAVQCFASSDDEDRFFAQLPSGFPLGSDEEHTWLDAYTRFGPVCGQRNGDLLAHVSTADVAQDMDLLRQAVGDAQLSYIGVSYGSVLGATYANLFPDKVRALVLDGNVDPVAWTTEGAADGLPLSTSLRLESDTSSLDTLNAFLDLCGQSDTAGCAFSAGDASATRAKFAELLQRLRRHPVSLGSPPITITYAVVVSYLSGVLTTIDALPPSFRGWSAGAATLQEIWTKSRNKSPTQVPVQIPKLGAPSAAAGADQSYPGKEQALAVQCAESPNPRTPETYAALADFTYQRAGDIGPSWLWADEPCASWPAAATNVYRGPWNRSTANPILVIGNTHDPETPYQGAVAMAGDLAHARLLTVDGYGHTALLNHSTCADDYETGYLVDGTLPAEGTTCQQDHQPFS
jgi:pimeloyl-ACP methyl ester carboxylesterase